MEQAAKMVTEQNMFTKSVKLPMYFSLNLVEKHQVQYLLIKSSLKILTPEESDMLFSRIAFHFEEETDFLLFNQECNNLGFQLCSVVID